MMNKKKIAIIIIACIALFILWVTYLSPDSDSGMKRRGNSIVKKIEEYRKKNNKLPVSLTDIGILVIDESDPPFYYEKVDSIHYMLSFGTSLGESTVYYSDSKKWEEINRREMK